MDPDHIEEAFDLANRHSTTSARRSTKVLVLYSGSYSRPDGLNVFLRRFGLTAVMVDNDQSRGGDANHNMLNDQFYRELFNRVKSGEFCAILAAPPCSTFSVSRFFKKSDAPPIVRDRDHIYGLPDVPEAHRREFDLTFAHGGGLRLWSQRRWWADGWQEESVHLVARVV